MSDLTPGQKRRLNVLFDNRHFLISLVEATIKALVWGPRDIYHVIRAVRIRIQQEPTNLHGLGVAVIARELLRRLATAGVITTAEVPRKSVRLRRVVSARVSLKLPQNVTSELTVAALDTLTADDDVFRALARLSEPDRAERWPPPPPLTTPHRMPGRDPWIACDEPEPEYDDSDTGLGPEVTYSSGAQRYEAQTVHERHANYALHAVFFATNRQPQGDTNFSGFRSTVLRVGICEVSIPRRHEIGQVERPRKILAWQFRASVSKHIVVQSVHSLPEEDFFAALRAGESDAAFVFVHGYNVRFVDAVRRTAQMKHDLGFEGAAVLFSWPSFGRGDPQAYLADEATIEWSQPYLQAFLVDLAAKTGFRTIHVIAHSMGNRAVAKSLEQLAHQPERPCFRNVVLAAPDIDRGVFIQLAAAFSATTDIVTLYASSRDRALLASRAAHAYPRAGECTDIVVLPKITTIDVSALDTDVLGHGYVTSDRNILSDLFYVLIGQQPPRFGLERVPMRSGFYWRALP
jgi:esterase/lipase superfamily enzyme